MADYAHPEVLAETGWVQENLNNPYVKIIEIDYDTKAYQSGHVPGALAFHWQMQLQDQITRDIIRQDMFEKLLGASGISPEHTVVLYGDNHNWFAAYGFWLFKIYGHADVRLMNGGRRKWLEEERELSFNEPAVVPATYQVTQPNPGLRALLPEVLAHLNDPHDVFIDVRSQDEYTGRMIAPPGMNETAQRGGHVPGAKNIPWLAAVNRDGTFKTAAELRGIYLGEHQIDPNAEVIAYCRIGERSSHTWFVLKYLLGFENVKNYDGGWTEYGSIIGTRIER